MNNGLRRTKCVVDTNVPVTANKATNPNSIPVNEASCVQKTVDAIVEITRKGCVVIDSGYEIFNEYRSHLSLKGQPGLGDVFFKWIHDNIGNVANVCQVEITKHDNSYDEFPDDPDLCNFDISDRKFIAVANAHAEKPPILEATDSEWWGYRDILQRHGIKVKFLCPDYVEEKYNRKYKR
ncbi:MAG: hypothetical protein AB1454_12605 [Candidatus Auribacterota bacterium]